MNQDGSEVALVRNDPDFHILNAYHVYGNYIYCYTWDPYKEIGNKGIIQSKNPSRLKISSNEPS